MAYDEPIKNFARLLREAYETRTPIAPLREHIGIDDLELAYKIQHSNTKFRVANGARIVGKKIGLTSFAVQKQLGVDQPDYGILFHDMEVLNGASVAASSLMQPKAEAEIAFILRRDLVDEKITAADVIRAIDYAVPCIEIAGSRIADWNIKITDTIADNASGSRFILGHSPKKLDAFDVVNCQMEMRLNGEVVSTGSGANCLGSPINSTLWLAKTMAKIGTPLMAGEIILSGALGPMANVRAGDKVEASFSGLGNVSVGFD